MPDDSMPDASMPEDDQPTTPPGEGPAAPEEGHTPPDRGAEDGPAGSSPGPASEGSAASGRARLMAALRRPHRGQLLAAVLLAVVGFAGVTQVRTNVDDSTYAGDREQDLIDLLSGLAGAGQRAQSQLESLQTTKDRLESSTSKRQAALDQAQKQAETLSVLAGQVPVTGPGIQITITEDTGEVKVEAFLDLIEELRSNGAEAIEVNDKVRLVAQSSVEQAVGGLDIDGTLVRSPFVVKVIGEPATLRAAVTFLRGPEDELENDGSVVHVDEIQSLNIRAVRKTQ